jgi:hypothetical protein
MKYFSADWHLGVPRDVKNGILGLTTNAEFGYWMAKNPTKVFYGRPEGSDQTRYLDQMFKKHTERKPYYYLSTCILACLKFLRENDH